jgi:alpha-1,2-rhamnosyltransferase
MTACSTPTLFIECTNTHHDDRRTGIQRVVRNILRNAPELAAARGFRVVPVVLDGPSLRVLDGLELAEDAATGVPVLKRAPVGPARAIWRLMLKALAALLPFAAIHRFLYAPPHEPGLAALLRPLLGRQPAPDPDRSGTLDGFETHAGSILLLLDSSWNVPLWPAARRFKARGGRVVSVIYDLIPLTHPDSTARDLPIAFRRWLEAQTAVADSFLCISAATAAELGRFMTAAGNRTPIAHFHLGSGLDQARPTDGIRPAIRQMLAADRAAFLMVGTIEPRKRHAFALDAFERYWQRGGTGALFIIGREAWRSEALLKRIARHRERGKRLFLIRDASDAELDYAYRHANALIMASEIEGFGLPIVEAFQRGLPVLCSDIPVFREVAQTGASYFEPGEPDSLADMLANFRAPVGLTPGTWLTWRDSTAQLLEALESALAQKIAISK